MSFYTISTKQNVFFLGLFKRQPFYTLILRLAGIILNLTRMNADPSFQGLAFEVIISVLDSTLKGILDSVSERLFSAVEFNLFKICVHQKTEIKFLCTLNY